jgi:hypothetical protein
VAELAVLEQVGWPWMACCKDEELVIDATGAVLPREQHMRLRNAPEAPATCTVRLPYRHPDGAPAGAWEVALTLSQRTTAKTNCLKEVFNEINLYRAGTPQHLPPNTEHGAL